jgi:hypothetical protein
MIYVTAVIASGVDNSQMIMGYANNNKKRHSE